MLIIFTLLLFSFCINPEETTVQNDDATTVAISEIDESVSEASSEPETEVTEAQTTQEVTETTVEPTTEESSAIVIVPTEMSTQAPATTTTAVPTEAPAEAPVVSTTKAESMVWIPNSGSKYHRSASCSNMKNPSQVTLEKAQSRGYTPCKKCC